MKLSNQFDRPAFQRWGALLLVLVVAVFGFAEAVHVHDSLAPDHGPTAPATHCLICVTAHSVPVITAISITPVLAYTATVIATVDPQLRSCLVISTAFIRPPPAVL